MTFDFSSFIHYVFLGFVALFPVVNPLGTAFIVSPYFSNLSKKSRRNAVKKVALYSLAICIFVILSGHYVLELFGLSVPIIQLGGGIIICKIGWDFLSPKTDDKKKVNPEEDLDPDTSINSLLFYPITFPMTTGAGTISVLFTLSAQGSDKNHTQYLINTGAIILAVMGICFLIYVCYVNANKLINYLGSQRERIVNSIMAFLIFCVGLQIAIEGFKQIWK